jgi:hypothetical protein
MGKENCVDNSEEETVCKDRYGCNPSSAKAGVVKNVPGHTSRNLYAITACRINRIQYLIISYVYFFV